MPDKTQEAINWALQQTIEDELGVYPITAKTPHELVDKVREYFNEKSIEYATFSYDDLILFL